MLKPDFDQLYRKMRIKLSGSLQRSDGSQHPWSEILLVAPDLFHLLVKLMQDPRVPRKEKVKLGAAVAYFLSPVDLLPVVVFGPLGLLDNVAVAAYALHSVMNDVDPEIVRSHWIGQEDILELIQKILGLANTMIGGRLWARLRRKTRRTA